MAKRLGIKCYDNELIKKVAEQFNIDEELLNKVDEKQRKSFWYSFASNYVFKGKSGKPSPVSVEDNLFLKQAKVIEDIYNEESAIIIGRCADFVLKNKENIVKVFVYSTDNQFKINRKLQYDDINENNVEKIIKDTDTQRANYYKHFTFQEWGDKANYDICIDTSKLGVELTIDIIEDYIRKRMK